ncbi:MAG: Rsd/AlgQ family anti-sigma factor [Methylococcales bacterium]|nr:Rsd/AlgQ family anti-sigma factor [Methylococcales bacterium]
MSAVMHQSPERRKYNQHLVSELQEERKQVWSLYCKVAELKPFSNISQTQELLTKFSQLLIDYASLGHFGIFEYLISGNERREAVLSVAERIYPEFSKTTEAVISFNDNYDSNINSLAIDTLEFDLSALGEHLAKRIDLEDRLCSLVLK